MMGAKQALGRVQVQAQVQALVQVLVPVQVHELGPGLVPVPVLGRDILA